jgi:hypothetical protein
MADEISPHSTTCRARLRCFERQSDYVDSVLGDMGGGDARDLIAGADSMVTRRIADPSLVGVMGVSYGDTWQHGSAHSINVSRLPCLLRRLRIGLLTMPPLTLECSTSSSSVPRHTMHVDPTSDAALLCTLPVTMRPRFILSVLLIAVYHLRRPLNTIVPLWILG